MGIKAVNLNYIYGQGTAFEQYALKNVNFEIPDGQFIGLIGHTGFWKIHSDPAFERTFKSNQRRIVLQWGKYLRTRIQYAGTSQQSRPGIPISGTPAI